ncbi:hypothetical protein FQZ97_864950 [compost metagenome]
MVGLGMPGTLHLRGTGEPNRRASVAVEVVALPNSMVPESQGRRLSRFGLLQTYRSQTSGREPHESGPVLRWYELVELCESTQANSWPHRS